ncbi:hypothetical protein SPI_00454 [Niveomyces insectorum RCEF 264]|uniref:Uncharacterized protein n=1 Tax=Niveomyces insectorum RCEF 264 TaxID=1081102 RepID=A0A162MPY8_9HYPO|nr:hypothetical protein SPI_00454 [Niveomyces insectorum RCEF 264]
MARHSFQDPDRDVGRGSYRRRPVDAPDDDDDDDGMVRPPPSYDELYGHPHGPGPATPQEQQQQQQQQQQQPPSYDLLTATNGVTTISRHLAHYPAEKPNAHTAKEEGLTARSTTSSCAHWVSRGCALTSGPRVCCACLDKRPVRADGLYMRYADGRGYTRSSPRWAHYCTGCKRAAATEAAAAATTATAATMATRATRATRRQLRRKKKREEKEAAEEEARREKTKKEQPPVRTVTTDDNPLSSSSREKGGDNINNVNNVNNADSGGAASAAAARPTNWLERLFGPRRRVH